MSPQSYYDLEAMRSVDIRTVDPATLVDIRNTKIDIEKPFMEKALDYLEQINNAYCFRCEDVLVKIRHNPNGPPLNTCMEGFFRSFPKT